jgi:SAM-dependent methyltransferase
VLKQAEWNRLADEFETQVCDVTRTDKKKQVERLVNALRLPKGNPVLLDLGCGLGTFIKQFGDRFRRIIGIDFAPRMVERAQARCPELPDATWMAMDMARAGEAFGACADLAVCMNVITSPSTARRNGLWSALAAVAKPRGHVLLVLPSTESACMVHVIEHGRPATKRAQSTGLMARSGAVQKHFARAELAAVLAQHGLVVKRIAPLYYPWSEEGLSTPRKRGVGLPFDWVCVAQRAVPRRKAAVRKPGRRKLPARNSARRKLAA